MVLAIIQARLSSNRLPGKVLKEILGKPMILYEIERVQMSKMIDKIVLATSTEKSDDALVDLCKEKKINVFRGSMNDLLDRYYQCAKRYKAAHIVRITGDCPMLDWKIIDKVIRKHCIEKNDYTSNTIKNTYPDGLDVEVMDYKVLQRAWREARLPSEREHLTQYIMKHPELFKQGNMKCKQDLSALRWTVDEPEDFLFVKKVYEWLYSTKKFFDMHDILRLLVEQPKLLEINNKFERNEGLMKSLIEDKKGRMGKDGSSS